LNRTNKQINKYTMKNFLVTVATLFTLMTNAQEQKPTIPQINVSGEGKVKITPDIACITLGVENTGKDALEVKKANDIIIDKVLKYVKAKGIPQTDFQTTNVSLYKNFDYEKKKNNFVANQTISITLKDIKKYDDFMMGVMETGVTTISGVEFKASKMEEVEREARKKAILNAKAKATDYVNALGLKLGKVVLISDNSPTYYPQPMYKGAMTMASDAGAPRETIAIGEIEITANVQIAFAIE